MSQPLPSLSPPFRPPIPTPPHTPYSSFLKTKATTHFELLRTPSSSSFVTFLKDGQHSNAALKAAATAMRHSSKMQASEAYHKGGHDKMVAAAMQLAESFASRFSAHAFSSSAA